ncbi:hypothetical protein CVT24_009418 [Panaeolus cyanescens]|uniref:Xylanolytic transcriptional activator regulatory domain-containing protein n=1 Tax=Panaeolus cyanescens TaxID=181874 RepID=A0A409VCQ8_9AGAR|nr:hypothetical protein CVT24_009418 [Panaeolus cyanescens]
MSAQIVFKLVNLAHICHEASKPRGPPKAYITGLEDRLEALEALVQKIRPDIDFSDELGPPVIRDSWKNQTSTVSSSKSSALPPILIPNNAHHTHVSSPTIPSLSPCSTHLTFGPHSHPDRARKDSPTRSMNYRDSHTTKFSEDNTSSDYSSSPSDAEDTIITSLVGRMKMTLKVAEQDSDPEDGSIRFHGRISTAGLVEVARQFKHMHMQGSSDHASPSSPDNSTVAQTRRPVFWRTTQWESVEDADETQLPSFLAHFPPIELCRQLVELYFRHSNTLYPLLHRPTFDRQWSNGLYRRNIWFAAVCMLVFAIGSSWSNDERVLPENLRSDNGTPEWTHAGRHFFQAALDVHWLRRSYLHPSSLFEIQTFALIGLYLRGAGDISSAWIYVSLGLRKAQDVGAHRKKVYRDQINTDDELWKRAFWHLVVFDRMSGIHLGRPPSVGEEDFDLDFPLEIDDEHWEVENGRFVQPPGVPPLVSAFNQIIRLSKISAFASRTLYAIDRAVAFEGVSTPTKAELAKQISQALQIWVDNIPEHPPSTTPSQSHPCTFVTDDPAALVCLDAVKTCVRIIRNDCNRNIDSLDTPHLGIVVHACCAFLLIVIWSLKLQEQNLQSQGIHDIKPPVAQRIEWMMNDVLFFIQILEQHRVRWPICSSLLSELEDLVPQTRQHKSQATLPHPNVDFREETSSSPSYASQLSSHPRPIPSPISRHELRNQLSTDNFQISHNKPDPSVIQNHVPQRGNYPLSKEQNHVYHSTQLNFVPADASVPSATFRSLDHDYDHNYDVRKLDVSTPLSPSQRPFPYISTSMRRISHSSINTAEHEYTRYPQARISGIRSNLADGPSSEHQDLIDLETNYTPISRHSRQLDHHSATYPDYLKRPR